MLAVFGAIAQIIQLLLNLWLTPTEVKTSATDADSDIPDSVYADPERLRSFEWDKDPEGGT